MINPAVNSINLINSILFALSVSLAAVGDSLADVEVTRRDCEVQRYGKFERTKVATKNLIFESSERRLRIVLNCTFCDQLLYGRPVDDGRWYAKRGLEEQYEPISRAGSADVELIDENRLKITNYQRNIGFYSCQPDEPRSEIVVQILVDHLDLRTIGARQREQHFLKFEHKDQFVAESARLMIESELEIARSFANFKDKYRLLYAYHKDTACSKCNRPDQDDQIGIKFMIFKCTLIELSYLKFNDSLHVEPSVSCGSLLVRRYEPKIYERLRRLPDMGFKHPCKVACDQQLPNLTQISVTEKPSVLSVFETESRGLLNALLERAGFYPVPYHITPAFNLTTINVSALQDRELKLACPVDATVETKSSSIFWYHNHTLISPLKLRIITDSEFFLNGIPS